jgi:hypothetical protein
MDAQELLQRYTAGERDFANIELLSSLYARNE